MTLRDITLANGIVLENIPDNITNGGAVDIAMQRGVITPEQAAATLNDLQTTETGGAAQEALIGAGKFFADRIPGLDNSVAAPQTLAASLGYAVPGVVAAFAAPGTIPAQAAMAGGLEMLRKDSTTDDIAGAAVLGGAGAAVGSVASRILTGAGKATPLIKQTLGQRLNSPLLRRFESAIQSGGGFDKLKQATQTQLNRTAAKAIGQNADELTPAVLEKAAKDIGAIFEALTPKAMRLNIAGIRAGLDDIAPGALGARVKRALPDGDDITGADYTAIRAALAERSRLLAGDAPAAADDINLIIDDLDALVAAQLGPDAAPLLRVARESWKNLNILESLPGVRNGGNVLARQLTGKLAQNKNGYGKTFIRNRGGVLDETQALFDAGRAAAELTDIVGDSGTATRLASLGIIGAVSGAVIEGDIEGAAKYAALGMAPGLAGKANIAIANRPLGQAIGRAVQAGGAAGSGFWTGITDDPEDKEPEE